MQVNFVVSRTREGFFIIDNGDGTWERSASDIALLVEALNYGGPSRPCLPTFDRNNVSNRIDHELLYVQTVFRRISLAEPLSTELVALLSQASCVQSTTFSLAAESAKLAELTPSTVSWKRSEATTDVNSDRGAAAAALKSCVAATTLAKGDVLALAVSVQALFCETNCPAALPTRCETMPLGGVGVGERVSIPPTGNSAAAPSGIVTEIAQSTATVLTDDHVLLKCPLASLMPTLNCDDAASACERISKYVELALSRGAGIALVHAGVLIQLFAAFLASRITFAKKLLQVYDVLLSSQWWLQSQQNVKTLDPVREVEVGEALAKLSRCFIAEAGMLLAPDTARDSFYRWMMLSIGEKLHDAAVHAFEVVGIDDVVVATESPFFFR